MCTCNPMIPATGEKIFKRQDVADQAAQGLSLTRIYRTQWQIVPQSGMGSQWGHNFGSNLRFTAGDSSGNSLTLQKTDGSQRAFTRSSSTAAWVNASHADQLIAATTATGAAAWKYVDNSDDSSWLFTQPTSGSSIGKLQSITQRNGWKYVLTYNTAGQLIQVINQFGRNLRMTYSSNGLLASVVAPNGAVTQYTWDASKRLTRVTYPDGKYITYVYENTAFPQYVTGIVDENGTRYMSITYDASGRATSSALGGFGSTADKYSVVYSSSASGFQNEATITDPLGTQRTYGYAQVNGHTKVTNGANLPGCRGEAPIKTRTQDTTGLVSSEVDFLGNRTTYSYDSRQCPTQMVRGSGSSVAATTTTTWHSSFNLPTSITESLRRTDFTYDTLGRLLTRTVTHTGGASSGKVQTDTYTYNAQGLIATHKAPNNAITSYAYDAAGNVSSITNALGHVTGITYDGSGRVTSHTAPTGLVTSYTYDPRGRVIKSTRSSGGVTLTTTLTYTASGQIKTIAKPEGLVVTYNYDSAQRMVGWSNNRGESGAYTLDNIGNVVTENTKNAGGTVALQIVRSYNNINRLSSQTVGGVVQNMGYNTNGEMINTSDAGGATTFTLDPLSRISRITDAFGSAANITYNGHNDILTVSDFKSVQTTYNRDAQGGKVGEASADNGSISITFDSLNLPSKVTDAMSRATSIQRDLLGRPTLITHTASGSDTLTTELRYDLGYNSLGFACGTVGNASKGHLCEMVDKKNGVVQITTAWQYNGFGQWIQKTQTLSNAAAVGLSSAQISQTQRYSYIPSGGGAGLVDGVRYPSGLLLRYQYDDKGRLVGMTWDGKPLIQGITWNALSEPTGWVWQFGDADSSTQLQANRTFDSGGRMLSNEFANYQYNNRGLISGINQRLIYGAATTDNNASINTYAVNTDALGRITGFAGHQYAYDANGNRVNQIQAVVNGLSTSGSVALNYQSNRLVSQGVVSFSTNAAGDLISDGWRNFTYDSAGRIASWQQTGVEPCSKGVCPYGPNVNQLHLHNGENQRILKSSTQVVTLPAQTNKSSTVILYGSSGYEVMSELERRLQNGVESQTYRSEHIYLPTPKGPMPVAVVISQTRAALNNLPADSTSRIFAVHSDHLNTPRRLTQSDGKIVWQWQYSAFGNTPMTQHQPDDMSVALADGAPKYSLRYPGQIDDGNSLYYNLNRYYHPQTGRYTQADPIGLDGGWNRFVYANNNPLMYVDPMGLDFYGKDLATEYKNKYEAAAWYEMRGARDSKKPVVPGTESEAMRNAEHYLYSYEQVYYLSLVEWPKMLVLTYGYSGWKLLRNRAEKGLLKVESPYTHTPPTIDELKSGLEGANDALLRKLCGK